LEAYAVHKADKEAAVAELVEQLRDADSLIVADYRGLTNANLETLRGRLREHGARFSVVKNTLARRAAETAGAEPLLALLEGPSAIAFVKSGGDAVAVAKALSDSARETKILTLRGGVLEGVPISGAEIETLAKLPPMDVLRSQVVGVIVAPLTQLLGLLSAPMRDLVGLIDARIAQLRQLRRLPSWQPSRKKQKRWSMLRRTMRSRERQRPKQNPKNTRPKMRLIRTRRSRRRWQPIRQRCSRPSAR